MIKWKIALRVVLVGLFVALSAYTVTIYLSNRALEEYPVRGIDVSSYQGEIDWTEIESNGVDFAFIKATEGSGYKDKTFDENIKNIQNTGIAVGAYHFMSFESEGKSQAENFISVCDAEMIDLPPVIDLELYGDYNLNPPGAAEVHKILDGLIDRLYEEYGKMPVIYTNRKAYSLYVSGKYQDCDIWICDLIKRPSLPDGRKWTFWQYSHTGRMPGYDGEEEHIDMNVFCGSNEEFKEYLK